MSSSASVFRSGHFILQRTALVAGLSLAVAGCGWPSWAPGGLKQDDYAAVARGGPGALDAAVNRAIRQGDSAGAVTLARLAAGAAPDSLDGQRTLARALVSDAQFSAAQQVYDAILVKHPDDHKAQIGKALVFIASGDLAQGRTALAALEQQVPGAPHLAADVGLALALLGDTTRASAMLETIARSPSADSRSRQNLALTYALAGDWVRARELAMVDVDHDTAAHMLAGWSGLVQRSAPMRVASLLAVSPTQLAMLENRYLAIAAPRRGAQDAVEMLAAVPEQAPDDATQRARLAAPAAVYAASITAVSPAVPQASGPSLKDALKPATPLNLLPAKVHMTSLDTAFAGASPTPAARVTLARADVSAIARPAPDAGSEAPQPAGPDPVAVAPVWTVQLGAFPTTGLAVKGWETFRTSHATVLAKAKPYTTITVSGDQTLTRLAVGSFNARSEAISMCNAIKLTGGSCLVREEDDQTKRTPL